MPYSSTWRWSCGLIAVCCLLVVSCRTTRETVEIRPESNTNEATDSSTSSGGASVRSSLRIMDVSLPPGSGTFDNLVVLVLEKDKGTIADKGTEFKHYKFGTPLRLEAFKEYHIRIKAIRGTKVIGDSESCAKAFEFKAEIGENNYSPALCGQEID